MDMKKMENICGVLCYYSKQDVLELYIYPDEERCEIITLVWKFYEDNNLLMFVWSQKTLKAFVPILTAKYVSRIEKKALQKFRAELRITENKKAM